MTVAEAALELRAGELVAFPTETVYGLGANALSADAVAKIYELKGRPRTTPLIVHVCSVEMAREVVAEWPSLAQQLAERWWPGPLTLVLPKLPVIPDVVTAGLLNGRSADPRSSCGARIDSSRGSTRRGPQRESLYGIVTYHGCACARSVWGSGCGAGRRTFEGWN